MNQESRALSFALVAVLLWSTVATAFKLTLRDFSPSQMVFFASAVATVILLLIVAWQGKCATLIQALRTQKKQALMLGLINPVCYYWVLFAAYDKLPASIAQPINYSWAITLAVLAALVLKQPMRRSDWLACLLGYGGVVAIASQGQGLQWEGMAWDGVMLALLSTLLWAGYWILNTKQQQDAVVGLSLNFMLALPFAALLTWMQDGQWPQASWQGWLAVSYIGLFEMGITFVFWLSALKLTQQTARLSQLIFLSPFISLILLHFVIGETIHPSTLFGLGLIICGLLIQQWANARRLAPAQACDKSAVSDLGS
ncbi:hypothetical protein VST7929_00071 [Vibrio stylophorae]|uniref:EamA domain-containing protein n=1 Tax=Vibrio stylophorae TaxID=659351 RepID=A0ABN8DTY1_9VIBR|nr:DMT family transporter [Vibrio stylophorae]CAH0532259.1 hypothetical protein VST7929_00071 [Vibrio stylophorae]